jgi:hypothetical protein
MGWRFQRRVRVIPGVTLNIGKRGTSVSIGGRGAHVTHGRHGSRATIGLPGQGFRILTMSVITAEVQGPKRVDAFLGVP